MIRELLLDTHFAMWLESCDQRLRTQTRTLIERCWQGGGTTHLSAVGAWEIALQVESGRIALDLPAEARVRRFVVRPGLPAASLDWPRACQAYWLHKLGHVDPADWSLTAAAIALGARLPTTMRVVHLA